MSIFLSAALAAALSALPISAHGSASDSSAYHWTKGLALRYLIQRDPYFADPKDAIETVTPDAPYLPPVVERLTEKVQSVTASGTATLLVTLAPEPGFEDEEHPQAAISRTVTVSAAGQVLSVSGPALGDSPAEQDLLRGFVVLLSGVSTRKDGLAVEDRSTVPITATSTSPDHDGTLLQTTQITRADHSVFDSRRGQLVRKVSTLTISLSLVMTGRGRRGSDDFGHVVPNAQVVQTLSVERQN